MVLQESQQQPQQQPQQQLQAAEFFEAVTSGGFQRLLEEKGGMVQVTRCFPEEQALEALRMLRDLEQQEWKLSTNLAVQDAKHKFWRYEGCAADVVTKPLLELAPHMHPEVHAAKYEGGGHITLHNDARTRLVEQHELDRFRNSFPVGTVIDRKIAMIYYLTKDWREEFGGCFVDHGGDRRRVVVPSFNSLIAFLVPRDHEVTEVSENAPPRFTIFGWFSEMHSPCGGSESSSASRIEVAVTVPEGSGPGDIVSFASPDGRERTTQVPLGVAPGQRFLVPLGPSAEPWVVKVPPNRHPGELVQFPGPGGVLLTSPVPDGACPGQHFLAMVPLPQPFHAKVPEGRQSGDPFTFVDADGVEQRAVVPVGATAGQTVCVMIFPRLWSELQVPIPESTQEGNTFSFCSSKGTSPQYNPN